MSTNWIIAIDWDRNNNFTDANDDVTSRVVSAKWALGMRAPYQKTADNLALGLVLSNIHS